MKKRMKRMISIVLAASLCLVEPGFAQAAGSQAQAQQDIAEPGNLTGGMQESGSPVGQSKEVQETGNPGGQPGEVQETGNPSGQPGKVQEGNPGGQPGEVQETGNPSGQPGEVQEGNPGGQPGEVQETGNPSGQPGEVQETGNPGSQAEEVQEAGNPSGQPGPAQESGNPGEQPESGNQGALKMQQPAESSETEGKIQGQEDGPEDVGQEGQSEPAEKFVPEGMTLVRGAEAELDDVEDIRYDAATGVLAWQAVDFAESYQVDVIDSTTHKEVLSVDSKTAEASLEQYDYAIDKGYLVQVTAYSERRISLVGTAKGQDPSLAAKSDGFFMDDEQEYYYYYKFASSKTAGISVVMSPAYTTDVTAVTEISTRQLADGYYEFQVLPVKMQETEYIRVEYSNNRSFKNSGTNFAYEAKAAGNAILQSVRAGDGHATKGYHRYQAPEQVYHADISFFLPGDTIYIRARIYNSAYRLEESEPAERKFSSYKTFTYKLPEIEMGTVDTVVTSDSITLRPSLESGWATGYEFQKKVNGSWVKLAKQTGSASYTDSGLSAGVSYSYRVRGYAYNRFKKKTAYTSWQKASAYTWGSALRLKAEPKGTDSVKLSWKKVKDVDGYKIYRCDTLSSGYTKTEDNYIENFANFTLAATIKNKSQTSYTDKKLTAGKQYIYVVCGFWEKDGQTSYLQESVSVRLSANEKMEFTGSYYTSAGKYTVSWNKMTGISGYKVQKKDAATGKFKSYKKLSAKAAKITLPKVKAGRKAVTYRIFPYTKKKDLTSKGGEFTVEPTLGLVKKVKAQAASGGIKVSWSKVSGADYYEVYRCSGNDYSYDSANKTYSVDLSKAVLVEKVTLKTDGALAVKPLDTNVASNGTISYEYDNEDVYGYAVDAFGQVVPALYHPKSTKVSARITGTNVVDKTVTVKGLVPKTEEQLSLSKDTGAFHQYAKDTAGVLETTSAVLHEGPKKGTVYYYVVRAAAKGKNGADNAYSFGFSKPASAVYTSASVKAAAKLKARNTAEEYAVISFQAQKNAEGHMIYRSEKKNSGYHLIATTSKTIYRDTTTKSGKTYYYKIVSYCTNESGARVYSPKTAAAKITIKKENISVLDLMLEQ